MLLLFLLYVLRFYALRSSSQLVATSPRWYRQRSVAYKENNMAESWKLTGEYFESCNCDLICACLVQAPTPRDRCDAALAFHIAAGTYGNTSLNDLNAVLVVSFPGPGKMRDGNWTAAVYVDEKGTKPNKTRLARSSLGRPEGRREQFSPVWWQNFLGSKQRPSLLRSKGTNATYRSPTSWRSILQPSLVVMASNPCGPRMRPIPCHQN